ncbi:23S rRNA (uracil(1939)-C(5))-methyltransferase RlmD [Adlercreutzia muris]|uniref:23S rRNA (Uracil(1939)-C(5))-methyltransferase RlmD n=1 Tax=Adlercreutzia muris TaxID=1796610 RepID=A0A7C8FW63_9ACTN|nr:23S rRNA (uracil(1939)-C(5))-methyltransferase RlmD [Adlercreutzia muris]KAB1644692.1 23S rRNA (uracil(1939)-C(5))-methyltransferase RlmD [Adlercreutzia muris]MCR2028631.1 23S rRNA (uracil(1939)-C(5))-methyltransferase RlmD [Adlercreutzia muris]
MTRKHDNKPKRASNRPAKVGKAPRAKRGVNRGRAAVRGDAQGCKEARPAGRGPAARPCALCPVFGRCGGCSQLDVPYEAQLAAKQQRVAALFEGLAPADVMLPIIGMEESFHYRNKVISPYAPAKGKARRAGGKGKGGDARLTRDDILTGMYAPGSHRLIPTDACAIENETAKRVTLAIRDIMARWGMEPYDEDAGTGFVRHAVVRVGHESGEVLVTVVTNGDEFPSAKSFCRELVRRVPEITTIVQNVNTRATNVILGEKERVLYGPGFILDTLCGLSFRISSQSFYQVNATQTEVLYDEAIRLAGLTGAETVIDAYCGTGTIGLVAAKRGAARVIGVDAVESAICDAAGNARHNGVKNAAFVAEDATAFMEELAASGERPCPLVLLMDPPRAGSTPAFLAAAATLAPERIVYISCNPATQARDVRQLVDAGYVVRTVRPVDMFPHTDHVESIVMLEREAKRSTTVGAVRGGDGGCSGRASSAATGSAQWTLSQSEDCLSESEYPAAPTEEPLREEEK